MNIIKNYNKLTNELKENLKSHYPEGFDSFTSTVKIGDNLYLVVPMSIGTTKYLIKLKKLNVDKSDFDVSKMKWDGPSEEVFE